MGRDPCGNNKELKGIYCLEQCNVCGKAFPVVTPKEMVKIINGKPIIA
jgi:rRNA maturation protein Nop10